MCIHSHKFLLQINLVKGIYLHCDYARDQRKNIVEHVVGIYLKD